MCVCVCADAHLLWKKLILRLEDSSGVEEDPSSVSRCCSRKTWEVGRTSDNISVTFLYLKCDAFAYTASHEKLSLTVMLPIYQKSLTPMLYQQCGVDTWQNI